MYNDEAGHAQSLMQQCQQAKEARAAAEGETRRALEHVEAARAEAREVNMASMRLKDELTQSRQEAKDLLIDNARYEVQVRSCSCIQPLRCPKLLWQQQLMHLATVLQDVCTYEMTQSCQEAKDLRIDQVRTAAPLCQILLLYYSISVVVKAGSSSKSQVISATVFNKIYES